jgi:predicted transposase YdaD
MSRNDILNSLRETIESTKEEALAIGKAEGKAEGELLKAKEIAVKLLATGLSKSEVAEIVGLDESELDIV